MPIESHSARPILEELQQLHDIAVREHGPHARSAGLIRESIQREQMREARSARMQTRKATKDDRERPA